MPQALTLVTGASGNVGGAVARALLDKGQKVRLLSRKAEDPRLDALTQGGAEIAVGSYDDTDSLRQAAAGADTVFALTTPMAGVDNEVLQGKAIADAAVAAGVGHLVFSSVSDADKQTGIPHFDSKYQIEQYLHTLDIPTTITGPAFFYNNVLFPWNIAGLKEGYFRQALPATRPLQQISTDDIGRFNALVIAGRDQFFGQRIDIAADELTGPQMAQALAQTTGRPIDYREQPLAEVRDQFEDMATMYAWFDTDGFSANRATLQENFPQVGWTDFATWAAAQDWDAILA